MLRKVNQVSSRTAVLAAVAEYDQLGRDRFLAKYGYGRARKYQLIHEGREYDSKAIAGVAFGKQFGTTALSPYELSGGLASALRPLKKLGFHITGMDDNSPGAAPQGGVRNPKWSRDELMLALHLYLHHHDASLSKSSAQVMELSQLLVKIANQSTRASTYRNPAGVFMKLMNFKSLDTRYTFAGKRGLTQTSKDDQAVWNLYVDRLDYLDSLVAQIRAILDVDVSETGINDADEDEIEDCEEGRILTRMHRFRERNRQLVKDFKRQYLKRRGQFECAGCDLDFAVQYGTIAERLIDVHHTKPVHTLQSGDKTSPRDLVLLCVSCHRAVHAQKRWLSVSELRAHLGKEATPVA